MSTVSRDIRLSVIAEVQKYAQEMAKIPGMTEKQAAAAAKQLAGQLGKAQAAAAVEAQKAAKQGADAWNTSLGTIKFASALQIADYAMRAAKAITGAAQEVADLRNELTDLSTKTGVSTSTLNGLRLAAEGSGQKLSDLQSGLVQLPKRMADAARGTGDAKKAFDALGVAVKNENGTMREADAVLRETLQRIGQIESPTERAALATQAFGESGTRLLQALGNPAALEDFIAMADKFGVDVGPNASKAAGDWQRTMAELKLAMDAVKAVMVDVVSSGGALESLTLGLVHATNLLKVALDGGADSLKSLAFEALPLVQVYRWLSGTQSEMSQKAEDLTKEFWELRKSIRENAAETDAGALATTTAGEEAEKTSKKVRSLADAHREAARAAKELEERHKAASDAMQNLRDIAVKAAEDTWDAERKLMEQGFARLEQIEALKESAILNGMAVSEAETVAAEARVAVEEETARKVSALRAQQQQESLDGLAALNAAHQAAHQQRLAEAERERQVRQQTAMNALGYAQQLTSQLGQLADVTTQSFIEALDKEEKARKRHAIAAFVINKVTQLANAAVQTALNVLTFSAAPPAGFGPVAGPVAAGVLGAASLATIAATPPPKFHTGRTPDEFTATLTQGEGVANRRAMTMPGFRDELQAANEGRAQRGPNVTHIYLNDRLIETVVERTITRSPKVRRAVAEVAQGMADRRGAYRGR